MAIFGGSKSKTSTQIAETNTTNVDNRVTNSDSAFVGGNQSVVITGSGGGNSTGGKFGAGGAGGGGANVSLSTTDFGAINAAQDISKEAFAFSSNAVGKLGTLASGIASTAKDIAGNATRDEGAKTTQLLIVAGAAVAVIILFRGSIFK